MSWFTDLRDGTLDGLGLSTGDQAAKTLGQAAKDAVAGDNGVKKDVPVVQKNPWELLSQTGSLGGTTKILGVSLPILALVGVGAWFLLRKR